MSEGMLEGGRDILIAWSMIVGVLIEGVLIHPI